ncbi:MAG: hypothetical protein H6725_17070 [Sandaracinaceae bacterium]|nr:hypothetical protein [Sandaracinaceae bacterium]
MIRVCFVCRGNLCCSPAARVVMEHLVARAGLDEHLAVESAATEAWHVGEPPDPKSSSRTALFERVDPTTVTSLFGGGEVRTLVHGTALTDPPRSPAHRAPSEPSGQPPHALCESGQRPSPAYRRAQARPVTRPHLPDATSPEPRPRRHRGGRGSSWAAGLGGGPGNKRSAASRGVPERALCLCPGMNDVAARTRSPDQGATTSRCSSIGEEEQRRAALTTADFAEYRFMLTSRTRVSMLHGDYGLTEFDDSVSEHS